METINQYHRNTKTFLLKDLK